LLRANFATEREARVPRAGAIQLITCQKAKGLEWDAVIVPFFSRQVYTSDDDFPRIIAVPSEERAIVAFSKSDLPADMKEALKQSHLFEWERILYVALTRARHTLVLATDHALFARRDGKAHSDSLTKWFRADRGALNESRMARLEIEPVTDDQTRLFQLSKSAAEAESEFLFFPQGSLANARTRADEFSIRFLPSSFTEDKPEIERTGADVRKEIEPEFRAATFPSAATRYGTWWHEFVQQISWRDEAASWDETFAATQADSPDMARSAREWKLLRERVSKLADFPVQFLDGKTIIRAEMPFFWKMDQRRCLEGFVDLALFEPGEKKWFILDWKTNRITRDKLDILRRQYLPQIAAYWKAVAEMTGAQVAAGIYSTSTGEFVVYDPDEPASEWERLRLSPQT
jgi:ATP-dependent exoDNAse (exonuclease V) beta subunit